MITDTHAHLDYSDYDSDRAEVLQRAKDAGITRVISIGTDVESSQRALVLTEKFPSVYATIGIHPNEAHKSPEGAVEMLRPLARHEKVVAIGETGLDYHYFPEGASPEEITRIKARQAEVFTQQLDLAVETGLNVVIHQRDSWDDTLALLRPYSGKVKAVFHCFGGTPAQAEELFQMGHYVSFTGIVTFKNAAQVQQTAAAVPEDRFMVETDCPYLAPIPHRGKRCEPAFTRLVAEKIASLRGITLEDLATLTTRTAEHFFFSRNAS